MNSPAHIRLFHALVAGLMITAQAHAVLFYDTADTTHNTTAPGGAYADSGWQYEGRFGTFLGTAIAPQYFITAQHIGGVGPGGITTFVSTAAFNGVADVTYNIDTAANGGLGYWDIAGTDFRIFKVTGTFAEWAPLYTGFSELNATIVTNGNGGMRGAAVMVDNGLGPQLAGWKATSVNFNSRWGTNQISGIVPDGFSPVGSLLQADFNALPGTDEAFLTGGDSGGGVFINDGGIWKLAGVNYGVEGSFDTNATTLDHTEFSAALFNKGGLYEGSDGSGWSFQAPTPLDQPISFYASRISDSASAISSIAVVPEPSSALLLLCALGLLGGCGRRRS